MKLGLQALVIAMVMALAAIPAASAENGGHGGGKPSWAGGGKPSWAGGGKPSWAGTGHASSNASHEQKPEKHAATHHEAKASGKAGSAEDGQPTDLDGLNPARYCKALRDQMAALESDFASMFGTNPNHANAFGKCVSRRAHGEDLSGSAGGDDSQGEDNPCGTTEPPASDGTETGAEGGGIDTTASDDGAAAGHGSDDEATQADECSNDSASDDPADDGQGQDDDEQGEDQGAEDGGTANEADSSDLATALRFLRL